MPKDPHAEYMSIALKLARKAEGMTSPNPLVGAVVVKDGKVIGRGYHKKAGMPHAEIEAFSDADKKGRDVKGAALYVTLEPCCHTDKRTPPCVDAIIERGISRVIVGARDPNPKVSGNGIRTLRKKGIEVITGVLEESALEMNEPFNKYITAGMPFVTLKLAATLDGKIASHTGDSKWIGSEKQRALAHRLRSVSDAVLAGVETVLRDDPRLNVRLSGRTKRNPVPVILDSRLRTPVSAGVFKNHENVIIATVGQSDPRRKRKLREAGADVIEIAAGKDGLPDIKMLMKRLGKLGMMNVLIEGGGKTAASALKSGVVDKIVFFYSPKILGGDGISMIGDLGISGVDSSIVVKRIKIRKYGEEFFVEGYLHDKDRKQGRLSRTAKRRGK